MRSVSNAHTNQDLPEHSEDHGGEAEEVGWRFINLDASKPKNDSSTKKIVRSHVMQRYRNEVAQRSTVDSFCAICYAQAGFAKERSPAYDLISRQAESHSRCPYCISIESIPDRMLGAGHVDPFSALPSAISQQGSYLLDHYRRVILGLSLSNLDPQILWLKHALADNALFHCLLLYAAQHNQIMTGASRSADVYYHRGEVMRIVNKRISSEVERTSDSTIDAIACLIRFEEMFGQSAIADSHRAGLNQIVKIRGGEHQLDPSLREVVAQTKVPHSLCSVWEFVMEDTVYDPPLFGMRPRPLDVSIYADPIFDIDFDQLGPKMIEIFCRLRNSSILVSAVIDRGDDIAELELNEQYLLKARLLERMQESRTGESKSVAWLVAAVLYASTALSTSLQNGKRHQVLGKLTGSLQMALLQEHPNLHQAFYSANIMLWMLVIGGLNAESFEHFWWYRDALARISKTLGLHQWADVKYRLRDYPWSQIIEVPCRRLWIDSVSTVS